MPRIAIFEDQNDVREMLTMIAETENIEVLSASNREEGLILAEQIASGEAVVDAVFLDGNLSQSQTDDKDAYDIIAIIRSRNNEVRIIGISGGDNKFTDKGLKKPFGAQEFINAINDLEG